MVGCGALVSRSSVPISGEASRICAASSRRCRWSLVGVGSPVASVVGLVVLKRGHDDGSLRREKKGTDRLKFAEHLYVREG